jgi:uncharacterized protein (TIGR03435 family)
MKHAWTAALAGALFVVVLAAPLKAQSAPAAPNRLAFDVASIKPNNSGAPPDSNFPLGPGDVYTPTGGYFNATDYPLAIYLFFAYKVRGNQQQYLLPQLPPWATSDRYDIQARVKGNPTKDQMREMMRALLAERFKLAVHYETREVPVLAWVLAKPGQLGPRLRPHAGDEACSTASPSGATPLVAGGFPAPCGGIFNLPASAPGAVRVGARNITIAFMADSMSSGFDRPMLDKTGLTGTFDYILEFSPEVGGDAAADAAAGPSLEDAIREQLGVKLVRQNGPVEVLVVDHVERPSAN